MSVCHLCFAKRVRNESNFRILADDVPLSAGGCYNIRQPMYQFQSAEVGLSGSCQPDFIRMFFVIVNTMA